MFSTRVRGTKAFAGEQKIRELKMLLFQTNALYKRLKKKIKPKKLSAKATNNMNSVKSEKYGLTPEETEAKSLASNEFRIKYHI